MRACTHKCDNSCSGVIVFKENLVEIGLIIAEILLFAKCDVDLYNGDRDLYFQG